MIYPRSDETEGASSRRKHFQVQYTCWTPESWCCRKADHPEADLNPDRRETRLKLDLIGVSETYYRKRVFFGVSAILICM